jgi:hypothetical protein
MQQTLVGRIALLRGLRQQVETFLRWVDDLRDWWPIAVPVLLYVFGRTYQQEQARMRQERVDELRRERRLIEKVEHQNVYEARQKRRWFSKLRRG